jgi:hypothetical protein
MKGLAAIIISPDKIITDVVPSPTSSSYALLTSNILFAAGWVTSISLKIACPSLERTIPPIGSSNIFNIDLGPRVVKTTSAIALVAIILANYVFLPVSLLEF